jgi:hypothetical protein
MRGEERFANAIPIPIPTRTRGSRSAAGETWSRDALVAEIKKHA